MNFVFLRYNKFGAYFITFACTWFFMCSLKGNYLFIENYRLELIVLLEFHVSYTVSLLIQGVLLQLPYDFWCNVCSESLKHNTFIAVAA